MVTDSACKFQVRTEYNVYRCYTEAEYQTRSADLAAEKAANWKLMEKMPSCLDTVHQDKATHKWSKFLGKDTWIVAMNGAKKIIGDLAETLPDATAKLYLHLKKASLI